MRMGIDTLSFQHDRAKVKEHPNSLDKVVRYLNTHVNHPNACAPRYLYTH